MKYLQRDLGISQRSVNFGWGEGHRGNYIFAYAVESLHQWMHVSLDKNSHFYWSESHSKYFSYRHDCIVPQELIDRANEVLAKVVGLVDAKFYHKIKLEFEKLEKGVLK